MTRDIAVLVGSLTKASLNRKMAGAFLDMPVLQQPEMYIGNGAKRFDENAAIGDEGGAIW